MKNSLLFVLVIGPLITFAQLTSKSVTTDKGFIGFYEFKPEGYDPDSTYSYPLMIFLHGIGERGNGTTELHMALNSSFASILAKGATMKFMVNGRPHAFLVLIPQMSKDYVNWQNYYVDAMIDYAKKNLKIDSNKIFLTGWSLGGGGAWKYVTSSVENARKVAGVIPVSPAPDYTPNLCNISRAKVAVWAHHARDDASIPLHYSEDAVAGINACSPEIPALITYYPSGGHPYVGGWAYDTLNKIEYPNIYQWMIGTTRANSLSTNKAPVPIVVDDSLVILPKTSLTLDGSGSFDPNDVIVHYLWKVIDGPVSPSLKILKADFPVAEVTGLEPGKYTFQLSVKDEFGVSRLAEQNVQVILPPGGQNVSPLVNAGDDVTTHHENYRLSGSGRDFDGTISSFHWRQVSGPVTVNIEERGQVADLWGMSRMGTYGIELSGYDNNIPSGIGRDTVYITRNPALPVLTYYLYADNPVVRHPGLVQYGLFSMLALFCTLPALIFNCFINKKFSVQNLDNG